jgi:NAD(P)-dependent dehydrogenase (short-subunit alcohol dehydrogenase family)
VTLARQGADVAICDIAGPLETAPYEPATPEDLEETARLVRAEGRRVHSARVDVADSRQVDAFVASTIAELGQIDGLCANAAIYSLSPIVDLDDRMWQRLIDVNLTGVFNCIRAVLPHMIERKAGRIVAISSVAGRAGFRNAAHYVTSKWGVIGLVKCTAAEAAPHGVTANAVCPTSVPTPMILNERNFREFVDSEHPTLDDAMPALEAMNPMPGPWVEPEDVSDAVAFLLSDEARFISGETLGVSMGWMAGNAA